MSPNEWDKELDMLAHDLARITQPNTSKISKKSLEMKKVSIVQLQVNIDRKIERIRRVIGRRLLLLPRENTLIHWAGILCDNLCKMLPISAELNSHKLWLQLVGIRMGGSNVERKKNDPLKIGPDDLVELATRKAEIAKTERLLTESIIDLDHTRKNLQSRYETLEITQAMVEGAGSLQTRFGLTKQEAMQSPTLKAIKELILLITSSQTVSPAKIARMERDSRSLMNMARHMINGWTQGRSPANKSRERFQNMLAQLQDMESETRDALSQHPPEISPTASNSALLRVQNSEKTART